MPNTHFKSFSTTALLLVLVLSFLLVLLPAQAQQGDVITIREDSPDRYVVVEGDTLWDIAGVFLEEPWLWPEIWQLNPQIRNPDLIYPGDSIVMYYQDGQPRVTVQRGGNALAGDPDRSDINNTQLPVVTLSPRVRREALLSPIPAISLESMSSYLSRNRIIGLNELDNAPTVIGSRSDTQFSSENDVIFASGAWDESIATYEIVRPTREVLDPQSGQAIAIEAELVGSATMLENNNGAATLIVENNVQEVRIGDYFVAGESLRLASQYFPVAPDFDVNARIVDINFGRNIGGKYSTVIVNLGLNDNIETGNLLSLQKPDYLIEEPVQRQPLRLSPPAETLTFSGEIYGRILIYKVFEGHSFALVLSSGLPVSLSDKVITP
ncbi:MAG: hypothetical protein CMQ38_08185 [Gammaproteobacteria bacterium]|nr:hypothetical protein [Gammaproteobacteria bacterium]